MIQKDKNGIPYVAGNRHERRKRVAWKRGKYMRDKKKAAELDSDLRKDAIADRVERQQEAAHSRAVARRNVAKTGLRKAMHKSSRTYSHS